MPGPEQPTPPTATPKRRIVLLSGMSGAGLSTALKSFEDLGYEAVDNLRLGLIPALIEDSNIAGRPLAVAVDTRNVSFVVDDLLRMMHGLAEKPGLDAKLVFLECSDEALQRRFTETRRRHPLALDRPVTDGIKRERELLWRLRDQADHVVDTSLLSIHELRRLIVGHYRVDNEAGLTLFVTSFSYRHGVPREADLVFDARFLVNPHWDAKLRAANGQRCPRRSTHYEGPRLRRFYRAYDASVAAALAALPARGQKLPNRGNRVHRWPPSLGIRDGTVGDIAGRTWLHCRHRPPRSGSRNKVTAEGAQMIGMVLVTHGAIGVELLTALNGIVGPSGAG